MAVGLESADSFATTICRHVAVRKQAAARVNVVLSATPTCRPLAEPVHNNETTLRVVLLVNAALSKTLIDKRIVVRRLAVAKVNAVLSGTMIYKRCAVRKPEAAEANVDLSAILICKQPAAPRLDKVILSIKKTKETLL